MSKFIGLLHCFSKNNLIECLIDKLKCKVSDKFSYPVVPKIATIDETIDILINEKKSICRFGDGELNLINGKSIPFQTFDNKLQARLIEVLSSTDNQVLIGIPAIAFYSVSNVSDMNKSFWQKKGKRFRKVLLPYIDINRQYYPAEVTLAYSYYKNYNMETYFAKFRRIWNNKDIVIITGETVFNKITCNIFDNACSIEYIYGSGSDAYAEYDKLLAKALCIDKNKLIIAILGPTAKPLCYDLAIRGYQALDLGHIAKSYDFYRKNLNPNDNNAKFFCPD